MQSGSGNLYIIVMAAALAIAMAAVGYFIAAWRHGRQLAQLSQQLEQALQQQAQTDNQKQALQAQLSASTSDLQKKAVHEAELLQQLAHAKENAKEVDQRLNHQLEERNQALSSAQQALEASRDRQHDAEKRLESALAEARAAVDARQKTADQLASVEQKQAGLVQQITTLTAENVRLRTEQDERDASHAREIDNFEKQKIALAEQFKLLSNEILEAKAQSLQESSKLSLNAVMTPFQQSIDNFKKEVQEIHHRETTQQGELRKELEQLKALNQQITTEAHELSTALRGQKKLQGNWGELVLENVLDRSGLQLGKDYRREVSFTTEEGRQRPDVIVYLPQGKHLIVDAKVSLNAYTRFVNAEDEAERASALKEHVLAVASRIKELSDRDYCKLPGLNSPDMVFMFIPIESAFVEALKADETLFQNAIGNNVLVATPTTLLTSLNIVKQLWRFEDQNKHTAALANKAESVFSKLNTFLGSFERIKKGLDSANEAYQKAENQLVSGKGNLVKQVGDFKKLAPAIKGELPTYFADKAALEIDFIAADAAPLALQGADSADTDAATTDHLTEFENS